MNKFSRDASTLLLGMSVFAFWLVNAACPARGQSAALLHKGQVIAAQKCGKCHAIGVNDDRPHAIVIPFRDFIARYPIEMLTEAQKTGVIEGHDEMPMFELNGEELRALLAYIDSLAPPGSPSYVKP